MAKTSSLLNESLLARIAPGKLLPRVSKNASSSNLAEAVGDPEFRKINVGTTVRRVIKAIAGTAWRAIENSDNQPPESSNACPSAIAARIRAYRNGASAASSAAAALSDAARKTSLPMRSRCAFIWALLLNIIVLVILKLRPPHQ